MSNTIMVTGRVTADPELRFTANGKAVASFTVADNHRKKDQSGQWVDDGVTFLRVNAWDHLAEECAEKITKGTTVTVTGQLRQRDWETKDGEKRSSFEIRVDDVAITLQKFRPRESSGSFAEKSGGFQRPSQPDDPWGSAPAESDGIPF